MSNRRFEVHGWFCRYDHSKYKEDYGFNEACIWVKAIVEQQDGSYTIKYSRYLMEPHDDEAMLAFLRKEHPRLLPARKKQTNLSQTKIVSKLKELFGEVEHLWVSIRSNHPSETNKKEHLHHFNGRQELFDLIDNQSKGLYELVSKMIAGPNRGDERNLDGPSYDSGSRPDLPGRPEGPGRVERLL